MKRIIITAILTFALAAFAIQAVEQTAFKGAGIIESTAGGFKFPDGSVQLSAVIPGCTAITYIPFVITDEGVYCLTGNLEQSITTGYAIEIQADNVLIDLNGWKLDGLGTEATTSASGIYSDGYENITIRNGTIRGFYSGVQLNNGSGHLVENSKFLGHIRAGIYFNYVSASVIRSNIVTSMVVQDEIPLGIWVVFGHGVLVEGNTVADISSVNKNSIGIAMSESSDIVVRNNTISEIISPSFIPVGLIAEFTLRTEFRDNSVSSSVLLSYGIYGESDSLCRGNTVLNAANAFLLCIMGPGNYGIDTPVPPDQVSEPESTINLTGRTEY